MKKQKQVRIEEQLWQEAKAEAARKSITLEAWIESAIQTKLYNDSLPIADR